MEWPETLRRASNDDEMNLGTIQKRFVQAKHKICPKNVQGKRLEVIKYVASERAHSWPAAWKTEKQQTFLKHHQKRVVIEAIHDLSNFPMRMVSSMSKHQPESNWQTAAGL